MDMSDGNSSPQDAASRLNDHSSAPLDGEPAAASSDLAVPFLGEGGPGSDYVPAGWSGFLSGQSGFCNLPSRGGLFCDEDVFNGLADALTTCPPTAAGAGPGTTQSDWFQSPPSTGGQQRVGLGPSPPSTADKKQGIASLEVCDFLSQSFDLVPPPGATTTYGNVMLQRPETPVLAYVDRASFPGFVDPDESEGHFQHISRELENQQVGAWKGAAAVSQVVVESIPAVPFDVKEWEAELALWKKRYGCSDLEVETPKPDADPPQAIQTETAATDAAAREVSTSRSITARTSHTDELILDSTALTLESAPMWPSRVDVILPARDEVAPEALPNPAPASVAYCFAGEVPTKHHPNETSDRTGTAVAAWEVFVGPAAASVTSQNKKPVTDLTDSQPKLPEVVVFELHALRAKSSSCSYEANELALAEGSPRRFPAPDVEGAGSAAEAFNAEQVPSAPALSDAATPPLETVSSLPAEFVSSGMPAAEFTLAASNQPTGAAENTSAIGHTISYPPPGFHSSSLAATEAFPKSSDLAPAMDFHSEKVGDAELPVEQQNPGSPTGLAPIAPDMPRPPTRRGPRPQPAAASNPVIPVTEPAVETGPKGGRHDIYTQEDFDQATSSALAKLNNSGGVWKSGYTDAELQSRDFFMDLSRHRMKEKGRQATGPIWAHLATQAKNIAGDFDLSELLLAMKLFVSVRYEDYELYLRILGEIPRYIKTANSAQLCEFIRLLARRRLRERNYVDMVSALFLQKIRITDDALPARLLVKAANAFAALECRSHPKFVECFLRHIEHRIEELDAALCCMVSSLFVANYMSDALRRAYLKRCAETQAGFQGPDYELRNLAVVELVLRKEHHSFVASVPPYVARYLEKVRQHASFDKWGSVQLPLAVAPEGPRGAHRADMCNSLQYKMSTATGAKSNDVFNSDMHRDVSACLTHLGVEHENGVLCGAYLLDIVAIDMVNTAKRIVYEVNSPHHYYEGTQILLADKRMRHRLLGRLGQKLHMINSEEWRPLTTAQKMTFLLKVQQDQQEDNSRNLKQQTVAAATRAPLRSLRPDAFTQAKGVKLKSIETLSSPIKVPVPPSKRSPLGWARRARLEGVP